MKKYFFSIYFLIICAIVVVPILTFAADTPQITSINPSSIYYNGDVDIIGTGFGNKTVSNGGTDDGSVVKIYNSSQGQFILSWSDTDIRVSVNNSNNFGAISLVVSPPSRIDSNPFPITLLGDCRGDEYHCGDFGACQPDGTRTRSCPKTFSCPNVPLGTHSYNPLPQTVAQCTYVPTVCSADTWSCDDWNTCSISGLQTRTCNKTFDCLTADTPPPATSQSCTPPPVYQPPQPSCSADIWSCGDWNFCSLSGVQNRSCRKTFDCPNVETAPPTTDQYCEPPNRPTPQTPPSGTDEILNQDSIIKSTVKLICPVDAQRASQGSGTIIDSNGTILTNKHVIAGTLGCLVGFINDFNDEPYFGERQIADIAKVSPNQDIAILKIRNPQNKNLVSVDITRGNSNLRLGTKVTIYGYPAKFGTKVTYTSGDFSGTDGSYIKTTAILEYGNSGGGSYLKDGTFIGIPSAVVKGELNALGYILSINTINSWLGNSSIVSGGANNNYSRVSVLEDIDLKKLGSLKLFIPDTDAKGNLATPPTNQNTQKITEKPKINQTQKEPTIIKPTDTNQKINPEQNNPAPSEKEQKLKAPWFKRLFHWLVNLF